MDIKSYIKAYRLAAENSEYIKLLKHPVDDRAILLEAGQGKHINGNMFALLRCLENDEGWRAYKPYVSVSSDSRDAIDKKLKDYGFTSYRIVVRDSAEYKRVLATAKYLFTDNSFPIYYIKRDEQLLVNTWHGTPLKRLGREDIRNATSLGNVQKNFLASDYLLFPNNYTRDIMMKDYMIDRVYGGSIVMSDYPRNDPLYDEKLRAEIREKHALTDKRVVAYMPTWRGVGRSANSEDQIKDAKEIISGIEKILGDDEILYVNFHFLIGNKLELDGLEKVRFFPTEYETYEFLSACDALISDYSSVMLDFAGTARQIVMYMYDYEDYAASKGFYFDVRELPFDQAYDMSELDEKLHGRTDEVRDEKYDWLKLSKDSAIDFSDFMSAKADGSASRDLLRMLLDGEDCCDAYPYRAPSDTEVIYVGDLSDEENRQLTSAVLGAKDKDELSRTVIAFESEMRRDTVEYLEGLDDEVEFIRCVGGGAISLSEYVYLNLNRNRGMCEGMADAYHQREFDRLFKHIKCRELQFLNTYIYERAEVVACADKTAFHRVPAYFYRRINDAYYTHPENVEKTIAKYGRVIDYAPDYGIDIAAEGLCKGIYAVMNKLSQTADEVLRIRGELTVYSPIALELCTDRACMGSIIFDKPIPCAARLGQVRESETRLRDGKSIFKYTAGIEMFAEIEEATRWYTSNVPVIVAKYEGRELFIPVLYDKKAWSGRNSIVKLGNSGKVCEKKRGIRYLNYVIKERNVTDETAERLKLALAFAAHILSPWKKPILLYEKNCNFYEESASVLFEMLVDLNYRNARFILSEEYPHRDEIDAKYMKQIVDKYSFAHYYNLFASKSIISSEALGHSLETKSTNFLYNTFVIDGNKNYVFLQHGVMYMVSLDAEQRKFFNKGTGKGLQRVVVSSDREKEHFTANTDYTDKDIYVSGLIKYDRSVLDDDADRIMIMPTWRPWEFVQGATDISETGYYRMLRDMIESVPAELREKIIIMPHPLISEQFSTRDDMENDEVMRYFKAGMRYEDVLRKSVVLITDYSSISYDAFYRGANVIFYWKDKDECMAEYGANAHLMLTEELAFGDVCYSEDELAAAIDKRYGTRQDEKFIGNYRQIVTYHDGRNTERFIGMAKRDGIL